MNYNFSLEIEEVDKLEYFKTLTPPFLRVGQLKQQQLRRWTIDQSTHQFKKDKSDVKVDVFHKYGNARRARLAL